MQTTVKHQRLDTLPKCDTCHTLATHGVQDMAEIAPDAEGFRQFEPLGIRRGCAAHPVSGRTIERNGNVRSTEEMLREAQCANEKK